MDTKDLIAHFSSYLALAYHEGRNVRHLVHDKHLTPQPWQLLINLPTNRYDAWKCIQPQRIEASKSVSATQASEVFSTHFRISLHELKGLFSNPNWKHAKMYGGNAWMLPTSVLIQLQSAIDRRDDLESARLMYVLDGAKHNTGRLSEKLRQLDRSLDTRPGTLTE